MNAMESAAGSVRVGGRYLTFFLAGEEYGVEILKVREIIGLQPITRVPRTRSFLRGVINLRGKVIPVMDLRARLGMEPVEDAEETCIVVVHARGAEMGLVVDRVSEVAEVASDAVEPPPAFGAEVDTQFLLGIAKSGAAVRLLLDLDRVVGTPGRDAVETETAGEGVAAAG